MKIKKRLFLIIVIIVTLAVQYGVVYGDELDEIERITIDCYYLNVCSSCNPLIDFYEYFAEVLDVDLYSAGLNVSGHNIYEEEELKNWKQLAKDKNYDDNAYPAFVIDGIIYPLNDNSYDYVNEISNSLLNSKLVFEPNTSIIIFFSAPGCKNCEDVKSQILDMLPTEIVLDNDVVSAIKVIELSIANLEYIKLFKEYCARFNMDQDKQETPLLFIGRSYYNHETANLDTIISMLQFRNGLDTPIITSDQIRITGYENANTDVLLSTDTPDAEPQIKPTEYPIADSVSSEFDNMSLLGVISAGLANGLNPCAISMFLMLLSLITMESKKVWKIGLSFALGKFIGFFFLGTVLFSIIDTMNLSSIRLVTGTILIVFSVVMIILNLMDYFAAKNERYGDIILQLPQSLRKSNHKILKNISSGYVGVFMGIGMGLLFSGSEFLCTGQIYLATIASAINLGTEFSTGLLYLGAYSLAFVIPVIVLVILAASGKRVLQMSEFFRKKMPMVKLLNAGVFAVVIVLTLIYLI